MTNVLITGGAGYIGSTLVPILLNKNYKVTVIDNLLYTIDGLLSSFSNKNFFFVNEDIYDSKFLEKNVKYFDFIIHLAAIVGYPACKKKPEIAIRTNNFASQQLAELAYKYKKPVIFSSTGSNYGHVSSGICNEDTPLKPISIYGETKTAAESFFVKNKNFLILRFATAFGVSSRMRLDLLINDFVYQAVINHNITVYEKNFKRTFLHVKDIAESIVYGIENFEKIKNNIYNIGNDSLNLSKFEIVELIKKKIDFYVHYADFEKDEDQRNYIVDYSKCVRAGFKSNISIDEGIKELVEVCKNIKFLSQYSNI